MPRILTKLRIDEVSAVDRGAGENVRILLMKRDDTGQEERQARSFNSIMAKAEADDGDDDAGDGGGGDDAGGIINHPIVQLATLLVASGKFSNNADALNYVMNTRYGAALLHRVRTHKGVDPMQDTIHSIMKSAGIAATCAAILAKGSTTISEEEICSAVGKIAVERWPELSESQAFSRIYTSATDEAHVLQKAIAIAKSMPFIAADAPLMVGGAAAQDLGDPAEAIAQLKELGRRKWPTASEAQQFARAMTDPNNAKLAASAHRRPSATTSFAFPR
jgi:hypothetical protein